MADHEGFISIVSERAHASAEEAARAVLDIRARWPEFHDMTAQLPGECQVLIRRG